MKHDIPLNLAHMLRRIAPAPLRRWARILLARPRRQDDAVRQELRRLNSLPRYQPTTTSLLGMTLEVPDGPSCAEMYGEIFDQQMYAFQSNTPAPYIIDGGANIGLTTLYFKRLYPQCEITAFEADQQIFSILQRNLCRSGYENVEVICRALAAIDGPMSFMAEGSYAGRLARPQDQTSDAVQAVRLRPYLSRHVNLLKLNIEGAETDVLRDCADLLKNVDNLVAEYHSFFHEQQTLHELLSLLAEAGFRLHLNPCRNAAQPLLHRPALLGMDLQIYIFAFRV
jgi:FkbM family methyltransferase